MSTIRADYISPSAGGTTKSLVRGTASAWVNFNGTGTIAARDSENVSSLTDNGTGDYTVNFSNAFGAADYSFVVGHNQTATSTEILRIVNFTTTTGRVQNVNSSAVYVDTGIISVTNHGDLA